MTSILTPAQVPAKIHPRDIEAILRDRIETGAYEAGNRLPSERELCEEFSAHRRAVRSAIQVLEREGLVLRQPNCRATVRPLERHASQSSIHAADGASKSLQLSKFVALIMWHGNPIEEGGTGQQRIFWGLNQTLGQAGYHAVFLDLYESAKTTTVDREVAHLQYALDQGFGGIVFYCYSYAPDRDLLRKVARNVPLVLLDREVPGVEADFVGVTNYRIMYDAVRHLIDIGHRRIAYLTRCEPVNTVQERLQGYQDALCENLEPGYYEMVISVPGMETADWPHLEMMLQAPAEKRPTAIVCVNDYEAIFLSHRLLERGLRIPEDISIVGCDNIISKLPNGVGLTTTAQPFEQIGTEAAKLFLRRTVDRNAPIAEVACSSHLIVRESSRAIS